jgi:DnaK suppressor protein
MTVTQERKSLLERTVVSPGPVVPGPVVPEPRDPELDDARWRMVLEARWRERLHDLTKLCVAFHEAGSEALSQPYPSLRHLTRRAVHARQALAETDAALKRLAAGTFGRCEDCASEISGTTLRGLPETRYCPRCIA